MNEEDFYKKYNKKKRFNFNLQGKWIATFLIVVILICIGINYTGRNKEKDTKASSVSTTSEYSYTDSSSKTNNAIKSENKTDNITKTEDNANKATETETKKEQIAFTDGVYKVGVDIEAGEYKIFSRSNCYVECAKDSTGTIESIIFNENLDYETMYVTLQKGDYFKITNAIMYKAANAPIAKSDEIYDGMFKVGVDELAPGEYKVVRTGENSYIEVSKDSRHLPSGIIMNDILTTDSYITLSKGQYVTLKGCKLIK